MAMYGTQQIIDRFTEWYQQVQAQNTLRYPDAMTLSTVGAGGQPSSRIVLLKDFDARGFTFYTNKTSRKSCEILENPAVALGFYWGKDGRQVRIEGRAETTSDAESDAYFATRPRDSQIGAWASEQSQPMENRATLEQRIAHYTEQFAGGSVPRPPHWGGWRVVPHRIEFWQEMPYRLHHRDVYCREGSSDSWTYRILNP